MKRRSAAALLLTLGLTVSGNGIVLAAEQETEAPVEKVQENEGLEKEGTTEKPKTAEEAAESSAAQSAGAAAAETKTNEKAADDAEEYVSRIVSFTDYTGMRVTYDANASLSYVYEVKDAVLTGVKCRKRDEHGKETLERVSFEGNVELKQPEEGEKYTSVAADVFGDNRLITYVKLPAGVTVVTAGGFKGCTGLRSVYLPSTVKEIGAGAFEGCTAMTQLSLPKSVTLIGDHAFKGDESLETVEIRDAAESELTSVGAHAFEGCRNLQELTLPQEEVSIGEGAFEEETRLLWDEF